MIASFDSFLEYMDIPDTCKLGKPIYKKMFQESGVLDASDKAALKKDIEKIRWLYTLKPSTINIAPYQDKEREYPEVAILHVEVTNPNRIKRIAHFINRSIPYPLIILFTQEQDGNESVAIAVADKRINQADKEKWVIEENLVTDWITFIKREELANKSSIQQAFLDSLKFSELPFSNFWQFYQAIVDRVVAFNCAELTDQFKLGGKTKASSANRLATLQSIEKLKLEKSNIANKLKKEKQMGRQVELNTQVKKINDKIAQLTRNL